MEMNTTFLINGSNQSTNFFALFDTDDEDFSRTLSVIQGAIYIPIFCAGIFNNILTILIILFNRNMHTVTNCYLLNLAISDTLPLIVSLPFEIPFLPIELPWGKIGCKFRALLAETSTNASILTISAFTVERYIAVCRPLHTSILTTRRAIKIEILIWFIAVLSSTPYFFMTTKSFIHCHIDQDFQLSVNICFYISAMCFFVLPAFILCILYALMAHRLYSVGLTNQLRWSKSSTSESCTSPLYPPQIQRCHSALEQYPKSQRYSTPSPLSLRPSQQNSSTTFSVHIHSMKKSAFKMLFAVVIAFIICYAPFHIQRLITSSSNTLQLSLVKRRAVTIFYFISGILYYLGSTINPIFYHLFSRKYREACLRTMKRILHCQKHSHSNYYLYRTGKSPPMTRLVLCPNLPQTSNPNPNYRTMETFHRSPNQYQTNLHLNCHKPHLLRLSLPGFNTEGRQV